MTYVTWKLVRTPFEDETYNDEHSEEITRYNSLYVTESLGAKKGGFSFKTTNFNGNYFGKFKPRDRIIIYRKINSTTIDEETDLLLVGAIKDAKQIHNANTDIFEVEGYNYSESLMGAIIFADPEGAEQNIPEAFQEALTTIQSYNASFAVTWNNSNPTLKSNNTAFPIVAERWYYEPFTKMLNKYSTNEYTTDGRYNWYVNKNKELTWVRVTDAYDYTYNQLTDPDTKSINIGKDIDSVINFVIIKGGTDPRGSPITARHQNFSSSSRHGLRYKYVISDKGYAKTQNADDIVRLGGKLNEGTLPGQISSFSYPTSNLPWLSSINETQVTSDDDYVDKFRRYIKKRLVSEGRDMVEAYKFGKLKVDLEVTAGSKTWGIGDLLRVTAYNVTLDGTLGTRNLRVEQIRYGENNDTYSLVEDVGTI